MMSVTRFGGEEFVLLLPDTDSGALRALTERLCMLVRHPGIDLTSGSELSVTISIGATMATANDIVGGVLHRADELLYASKRQGRNRVITDTP